MKTFQKLKENKTVGIGVAAALIIFAVGILGFQFYSGGSGVPAAATSGYYTDDNGKTFFKDDLNKLSPFGHNGKQAYRADVFKSANGEPFVGLVYRYTPAGRKEVEQFIAHKTKDPDGSLRASIDHRGMEVRPVRTDKWALNDENATERLQTSMKDASGKPAQLVLP